MASRSSAEAVPFFFSKTSMDTAQPSRRPGVDQGDANRKSCGMKFSGHDSSVLAFLAQRPLALSQFERTLGQDALPVARYHAGVERDVRPELRQTGDAIRAWAEGRAQRERLSGKSK